MGFGGIGEMMFILVLGLLLFGPKKLPEIARQVGKVLGEFKKASAEFQAQLNDEVRRLDADIKETDNNTNSIAPPYLPESTPRNSTPQYALEPNSGQHEGEAPVAQSAGEASSENGTAEPIPLVSTTELGGSLTPPAEEPVQPRNTEEVHGS